MIDFNLLIFLTLLGICIGSLSYYAYKAPKTKMIGIKAECCKSGMAIQPVFPNDDNTQKILYWQCIHCHRVFHYVPVTKGGKS